MDILRAVTAYYPAFHLGGRPVAVECVIAAVEANGKRYVKTPFAMLDSFGDDDVERQLRPGGGYYRTAAECMAYLSAEYPWASQAELLMDTWTTLRHHHGPIVGDGRMADMLDVSPCGDAVGKLCRGHRSYSLRQVRLAVKAFREVATE